MAVCAAAVLGLTVFSVTVFTAELPARVAAAVIAICAAIASGVAPNVLPSSKWRVPRRWMRYGRLRYAGAFGATLGVGFVTALGTPLYLAIPAWVATRSRAVDAVVPFVAFATSRALFVLANIRPTSIGGERDTVAAVRNVNELPTAVDAVTAGILCAFLIAP